MMRRRREGGRETPAAGPDMNGFRGICSGDIRQIRHQYPIPKQIVNGLKENRGKDTHVSSNTMSPQISRNSQIMLRS